MNKKKLFSVAVIMIMIAILSFSTLAWFTDSDGVTNEFMVAGSGEGDPEDVFSLDVWEKTPESDKEQVGYHYEDILPGDVLKKDVYVENTGSYDQYIRVIVVVSDAQQWGEILGVDAGEVPALSQIVAGLNYDKWTPNGANYDPQNNTYWYVLYGTNILEPAQTTSVFTDVKIPASMTQEQAAAFEGGFIIDIFAQAVQTRNVGASCYEAFQTVGLSAVDAYNSVIAKWANP